MVTGLVFDKVSKTTENATEQSSFSVLFPPLITLRKRINIIKMLVSRVNFYIQTPYFSIFKNETKCCLDQQFSSSGP